MKNFKGKNKDKSIMQSKPVLFILAGLILFFIINLISFVGKMEETAKNRKIAEEKVTELKEEKVKLSSSVDQLNTPQGTEDAIRNKFGLGKDGEGVIVVLDDNTSTAPNKKPSNFWSFFTKWFK